MKELVSVVIPIYNVEKHLERCLNSVTSQTYTNLEIILVNDGSTDSSSEICEKWAKRDSRIKVIHKANAGLGMARNTGIENATGQYICFFDSDDYVDIRTLEFSLNLLRKTESDLVVFGMSYVDIKGNVIKRLVPESERDCYFGDEVVNCFLPGIMQPNSAVAKVKNVSPSVCSCLFSMELIKRSEWRFVSEREIISEDIFSLLILYKDVRKAAVLREAMYYYCENDMSLTHTYREDRFQKSKYCYQKCIDLCREYDYPYDVEISCMDCFLGNTIGAMKQAVEFSPKRTGAVKKLRKIIDDELLQSILNENLKEKPRLKVQMLFWAARHRHYFLCYLLLSLNNKIKK